MNSIYDVLERLSVDYVRHDHPAVFTCEEAAKVRTPHSGDTKNLFLRNKKGNKHFLVSVGHEKRVDLKALGEKLGEKLGFASPERLKTHLGLTPGSVSLLGLANNTEKNVIVILDADLWKNDVICCHPNINTATLEIKRTDLERFFEHCGHEVRVMEL